MKATANTTAYSGHTDNAYETEHHTNNVEMANVEEHPHETEEQEVTTEEETL